MGITGLDKYMMDKDCKYWRVHKFRKQKDPRHLVLDGKALIYYIFEKIESSCRYPIGGAYKDFNEELESFLDYMKAHNWRLIVIFHGFNYDSNQIERAKKLTKNSDKFESPLAIPGKGKISTLSKGSQVILPPLAYYTFFSILREKGVAFLRTDGPAHQKVAQIANHLKCPVLANDSNYYIFDITHGYIPIRTMECNKDTKEFSAKVYIREEFVTRRRFAKPTLIFGIPLLCGSNLYPPPGPDFRVANAVELLAKLKSLEECTVLKPRITKEDFVLVRAAYDATPPSLDQFRDDTDMKVHDGSAIDKRLLRLYREGRIWLQSLCTGRVDLPLHKCHLAGRDIRKISYALHHCHTEGAIEVIERTRSDSEDFKDDSLTVCPRKVCTRDDLFRCLGCENMRFEGLEEEEEKHLVLLATRHWVSKCSPDPLVIEALLHYFVLGKEDDNSENLNIDVLPKYTEWQVILKDLLELNVLLDEPFKAPIDVSKFYDGKAILCLLKQLQPTKLAFERPENEGPKLGAHDKQLLEKMFLLVTSEDFDNPAKPNNGKVGDRISNLDRISYLDRASDLDKAGQDWNGAGQHWNGDGQHWNGDGQHWNGDGQHWNGDGQHWNGAGDLDKAGQDWNGAGDLDRAGQDWNGAGQHWNGDGQHWNGDGQHWNGDGQHWNGDGQHWNGAGQDWNGAGQDWNGAGQDWDSEYSSNNPTRSSLKTRSRKWRDDYEQPIEFKPKRIRSAPQAFNTANPYRNRDWNRSRGSHTGTDRSWDRGGRSWDREGRSWDRGGHSWDRGSRSWDRGGPSWDRGGRSWDRGGRSWDRGGRSWDREGRSWDRGGHSWDRGGRSWDRGGPSWDRGGRSWDRGGRSWDREGRSWDRGGHSWDRGGRSWDRGGPSWDRGGRSWDRGGRSWDRGGRSWDRGGRSWDRGGPKQYYHMHRPRNFKFKGGFGPNYYHEASDSAAKLHHPSKSSHKWSEENSTESKFKRRHTRGDLDTVANYEHVAS